MKLKPVKRSATPPQPTSQVRPKTEEPKREKKANKLPSDEYRPLLEPRKILVKEVPSRKDSSKVIRQYLEVTVKRFDADDGLGLPHLCVQMYQESEFYTGYLKGKSIYLPIESSLDFIDILQDVVEECDQEGIVE